MRSPGPVGSQCPDEVAGCRGPARWSRDRTGSERMVAVLSPTVTLSADRRPTPRTQHTAKQRPAGCPMEESAVTYFKTLSAALPAPVDRLARRSLDLSVRYLGIGARGPKASVVVPVYNVAPYLEACLRSLSAQTYRN